MNEFWGNVSWRVADFFFPERQPGPWWALAGRALLLGFIGAYGWQFHRMTMMQLSDTMGESPLHSVHLVFHEAGHVIFSWFGDFMHVLGGSLLQVLMPFIWFVAARFWGKDAFAGALCLWLMGHSLVDVAPYINDARSLQLMLLGGGTGREVEGHDWEYLLTAMNVLHKDVFIARWVLSAGRWVMALSLVWAAAVLVAQFRARLDGGDQEGPLAA
ncbi:MAG: zinc ribbon domain-containing protein [Verrucomicrobia bacterium]|nr:zinc ribbon domain-containing protein [Verrucomicrobiota bacterium]